jgi:K+-transporting ATPase KdpF subunit
MQGEQSPQGVLMDFMIAGIIALALLVYLAYAVFNPDKF